MTLISAGYLLLALDSNRFPVPIIYMSEISALDNWAGSYTAVIIIIIIIIIRCFVLAQECPRIDGVRRLMAYSTSVYGHPVADIMPRA